MLLISLPSAEHQVARRINALLLQTPDPAHVGRSQHPALSKWELCVSKKTKQMGKRQPMLAAHPLAEQGALVQLSSWFGAQQCRNGLSGLLAQGCKYL